MTEPRWLTKNLLLAIHGRLLAEHGGSPGLRDEALLESALAGPKNQYAYGASDVYRLAAAYAFEITKNHPFIDGNKRTALVSTGVFLELNGLRLTASEADAVAAVVALSRGDFGAAEFAAWLRLATVPMADEGKRRES